ncbi:MAG TPA: hypothetical protein VLJ76_10655 [Gaiellaceae bacterium]|nr:hypothetical protein [Gaiellaceae bacterium]
MEHRHGVIAASLDGEFRTGGSALYHLGTTATGLYVDRYALKR